MCEVLGLRHVGCGLETSVGQDTVNRDTLVGLGFKGYDGEAQWETSFLVGHFLSVGGWGRVRF